MKTKQAKEDLDKGTDEEIIEPKTRARKKASDINEEDKNKPSQDEPKTSKDPKKTVAKPKVLIKKRPLGIRKTKTLRNKKAAAAKKKVVRQTVTRSRKAAVKPEPNQEKEPVPLIPASDIKKEPVDDNTPNSRSSSPKTSTKKPRLSSDMIMMKSVLADTSGTLMLGSRTSPYSMRSERSNSPSLFEGKNLRSGKPRKVKSNLLNEIVIKEQKKRRRLLSDSKTTDSAEITEDCKKSKRGRSCSRDGSEISRGSDITESDISLNEGLNDTEGSKELNKKLDKSKTDVDIDIENNVQISTIGKVPSLNIDSKLAETKPDTEPSSITSEKKKKKLSLNRSTSLDSDNNNSNRLKLDSLNTQEIEEKLLLKTENDTLFEERSSILNCMSKTFNSKEVSKNIRRARRGKKKEVADRTDRAKPIPLAAKNGISSTITNDSDEKQESIDTLAKEINDLIFNLDQNIDQEMNNASENTELAQPKPASKPYGQSKPLGDNNSIITPETPIKDKDAILSITNESTPSKNDDCENIRLHYDEDSAEKSTENREISYKHTTVASIDKLMDRLKEFEEFDKRRQRQESESKSSDSSSVMVTSEVVLVNKSGADIKPLKDIQAARSPEKVIEKENVLSCFENNSAISIVKRDQVRKSVDIDLPNSVTLIKRNSFSARKESTSSNHSKESDAISIFEKSLGKDVTLTEIRKSVDKSATPIHIDLHQFTNPQQVETQSPAVTTMALNSSQISITPRVVEAKLSSEVQITKRKSRESMSRKSSESGAETEEKMTTLEKIRSPPHQIRSPAISITPTPVAVKSPEAVVPVETEALAPPLENVKAAPEDIPLTTEVPQIESSNVTEEPKSEPAAVRASLPAVQQQQTTTVVDVPTPEQPVVKPPEEKVEPVAEKAEAILPPVCEAIVPEPVMPTPTVPQPVPVPVPEPMPVDEVPEQKTEVPEEPKKEEQKVVAKEAEKVEDTKEKPVVDVKPKSPKQKSARNSTETQPGPSNVLLETPESQRRKENVLRTLGLLTHKAANEAKMEKMKQKERIYGQNYCGMVSTSKGKTKSDYTGTLKTVIKLNRGAGERDKKKYRSSLKMTFQKSKNRSGKPQPEVGEAGDEDDAYYTIEKREGGAGATSDGGHRKSYNSNRLNNHDGESAPEPEPKETLNLVIPEKASSFSIHPGRLCMDQCFYCGGKFGLYDTPCHIAQMKSSERQKKVLSNEEKLTIDSCLCDACYRHVDRRANCPSYRKRPAAKQPDAPSTPAVAPAAPAVAEPAPPPAAGQEKPPSPGQEKSEEESSPAASARLATCHTEGCSAPADQSIRRKWLIKMRSSVSKLLKLQGDYPGLHTIPLCGAHHAALAPLLACALCRRRLTKHHNLHFIHHGYAELNPLLAAAGVPVRFAERPVLCKVCRYYCTLLQRPGHNDDHAHAYRRRLLQIYNVEIPPELEQEAGDSALLEDCTNSANNANKKKKTRTKSKQRRSTDPDKLDSESSERTTESSPEKEKVQSEDSEMQKTVQPLEEDIESLISSNKIPVPGACSKPIDAIQTEGVDQETTFDPDPLIPVDKQTELQYLLQKQNNPAQFLPKIPNLTQKHKNILKIHNIGVSKPAQQHRTVDKNAKRIQKLGQIVAHKDKSMRRDSDVDIFDPDKAKEMSLLKNIPLNDECTIETIPNKKPADINTLKNKWQMSESFSQVKKNLSELSKKLPVEKDPKKLPDTKYSNPVKRLETNPSISVRELFPGEEEMNLQCNIEFNNVKGVTPEGWEKCNTMIQYDLETKRLWTELQRPYGNQSSFLRHLILLEKYFRSGDLVLAHNASPHAANYSTSVQSRLRAYDNVPPEPRRNEPSVSLIEFRKKPPMNGKSLLKSNQTEDKSSTDPKKFMPPPGSLPKKPKNDRAKTKALPPELIAITPNIQGRKAIQNVLQNIQQLVKGVSASDPTEVAAAPVPSTAQVKSEPLKDKKEMPGPKYEPQREKRDLPPPKYEAKEKKDATKSDTPKKHKNASKAWRPTLLPITPENLAKIARDPLRTAVDGHELPSLVQVLSSGSRHLITFEEYNKMCIIRRERQKRLQEREARNKRSASAETSVVTELQPSPLLGNGGTVVQHVAADKDPPELLATSAATILKNVGLKNITIAPIAPKTSTVTSLTQAPIVSSPALLVTSTPVKTAPAVSASGDAGPRPALVPGPLLMPKIPKSLTVIPQSVPEPRP